jgi:eukaryotic-like serine/threonine-protein kinase
MKRNAMHDRAVIGERIGTYTILRQIGEGGMGSVWLAEHSMLGRKAALKMLHSSVSGQSQITARFFNEARAAAAIRDPGIVQIFDFGHHTDGRAYIVMELLEGEPLDSRLNRLGVLQLHDALRIARQVASSLGAAHRRGIVHRDLKPDNVFLVRDPEVFGGERAKILDFGIAKFADASGMKTGTSVVMGTPYFMSPEQCRGAGEVDQRSDVYALGCVLFTLLTGRPPFVAAGPGDIIAMHLREQPTRPSQLSAHVPAVVDQFVARALQKDPQLRFAGGQEAADALDVVISALDGQARSAKPAHQLAPVPRPAVLATAGRGAPALARGASSKHKGTILLGAGAALVTGLIAVLVPREEARDSAASRALAASAPGATAREGAATPAPAPVASDGVQPRRAAGTTGDGEPPAQAPAQAQGVHAAPVRAASAQPQAAAAAQPQSAPVQPQAAPAAPAQPKAAPARAQTTRVRANPTRAAKAEAASAATDGAASSRSSDSSLRGRRPSHCAGQEEMLEEFIIASYTLGRAQIVAAAKMLAPACLNAQSRLRLSLIAMVAACEIGDRVATAYFFSFSPVDSLRERCPKYLARTKDKGAN